MARPRSLKPSYCLHKSTHRAYVLLNGRQVFLGRYGTQESRDKYDRAIGEWIASGRAPLPDVRAGDAGIRLTVSTIIDAWIDHARVLYGGKGAPAGKLPPGELQNFKTPLSELRRLYGATPAIDFGPKALKVIAHELARDREVPDPRHIPNPAKPKAKVPTIFRRGMVRKVVNRQLLRIKQVFRWAVEEELMPGECYARLKAMRGLSPGRNLAREGEPVKPVPQFVLEATLPHLSRYVRAMVNVQLLTGMRPGEMVGMKWAEIDVSGEVWTYRPATHKNLHHGIKRVVEIGPAAQTVLREFFGGKLDGYLFCPDEAEAERREEMARSRRTPLHYGNTPGSNRVAKPKWKPGDHYDVASYRRAIARACDRANAWAKGGLIIGDDERLIPRWHPHQLRHNHATMVRAKFGVEAARVALGHTTVDTTEIYAERDDALRKRVALEIG